MGAGAEGDLVDCPKSPSQAVALTAAKPKGRLILLSYGHTFIARDLQTLPVWQRLG